MIAIIKKVLSKVIPASILRLRSNFIINRSVKQSQKNQARAVEKIRKKKKIKVAFFLIHKSVWKYEKLYELLLNNDRFEPVVVICPYTASTNDIMKQEMEAALNFCKKQGYKYVETYNHSTQSWVDVKATVKPDIIFFTNPQKLTRKEYYITNYKETLTCYTPYAFVVIHLLEMHYNQIFHHLLWRFFCETEWHEKIALQYSKRDNVRTSGFPGLDTLASETFKSVNVWKNDNGKRKKIIWAPHHSIGNDNSFLTYSNFLDYADLIFNYTINNSDKVQVAFKPHPLLKTRLYQHSDWGKERTDEYYRNWDKIENGQLEEGDYIDLFYGSDAMIMDSASFMVEYLYSGKPVLFMLRHNEVPKQFNDFGKQVFSVLYQSKTKLDLEHFFEMVIGGEDYMRDQRNDFFEKNILPDNGKLASENIYNELINQLV